MPLMATRGGGLAFPSGLLTVALATGLARKGVLPSTAPPAGLPSSSRPWKGLHILGLPLSKDGTARRLRAESSGRTPVHISRGCAGRGLGWEGRSPKAPTSACLHPILGVPPDPLSPQSGASLGQGALSVGGSCSQHALQAPLLKGGVQCGPRGGRDPAVKRSLS